MNREDILYQMSGPVQQNVLVEKNQDVRDIIALMKYKHKKCEADYDKIAGNFQASTTYQICKKIWTFCKKNIKYEIESEELQTISSPQRILERGFGDCKHYALFSAGILDALNRKGYNIDWVFRYASYNILDDTPGHVFVVVRDGENEIWIDPVLSEFNYHKNFSSAIDKKISPGPGKIGMIYYDAPEHAKRSVLGLSALRGYDVIPGTVGTTAQTGILIEKISATVAAVPVYPVSTIIGAAGALVGFFITVFGSKYASSTQVRWLTQLFEYFVMGNCNSTSDNKVNDANTPTAQKWFAIVLGIPIYDRYRWNAIAGHTGFSNVDSTIDARARAYLAYPEVAQAGITYDQAVAAAHIADQLTYTAGCGGWKNATAAPSLISTTAVQTQGYNPVLNSSVPGAVALPATDFFSNIAGRLGLPEWIIWAAIAGGAFLLLNSGSSKHKHKHYHK